MIWLPEVLCTVAVICSGAALYVDLRKCGLALIGTVLGPLVVGAGFGLIRAAIIGVSGDSFLDLLSVLLFSLLIATRGHPSFIVDDRIVLDLMKRRPGCLPQRPKGTSRVQFAFIGLFAAAFVACASAFPRFF